MTPASPHSDRRPLRLLLLAAAWGTLALAACAPLTRPPGVMCLQDAEVVPENPDRPFAVQVSPRASRPPSHAPEPLAAPPRSRLLRSLRRLAEGGPAIAPRAMTEARQPLVINVLVLSGGAQWGAYGSGFLNGLYGPDAAPQSPGEAPELGLAGYNLITGVSTGALMAPNVWSAVIWERAGDHGRALEALAQLKSFYSHSDEDLFAAKNPLLSIIGSNGLADPKGRLEKIVRDQVGALAPQLATDARTEAVVGAVDLKDGMFYAYDLGEELKEPASRKIDCLTETLLASAAIPLSFPPRFIDGQPFVDGGVRFLAFVDELTAGLHDLDTGASDLGGERYDVSFNVRVIVNGNQSPNDPGAMGAAQAAACDNVQDLGHAAHCAPVADTLLGSFLGGSGGKGIILRVTQDVMVHQTKIDSVYKLYHDWRDLGLPGTFKYTYVSNKELAAPPDGAKVTGACQPTSRSLHFDPAFQACLFEIGRAKGVARDWTFTDAQGRANDR